jgi:hypothetical protein
MVLLVAIAHVTPVPGDVMVSHLAGRLGIVATAALAGAADRLTGSPPASNAIVVRKVEMTFDLRMMCFLCFLFIRRLEL